MVIENTADITIRFGTWMETSGRSMIGCGKNLGDFTGAIVLNFILIIGWKMMRMRYNGRTMTNILKKKVLARIHYLVWNGFTSSAGQPAAFFNWENDTLVTLSSAFFHGNVL